MALSESNEMTKPVAKVTAVVVTYQSERTIREALAGLKRCYDAGLADTIVVDNGSRDRTKELVAAERSWVREVPSPGNIGYGRGCNLGFEKAETKYLAVVNPDAVLEPEALRTLVDFLEARPNVGMVGPALIEGEGEFQSAGSLPRPWDLVRAALPRGAAKLDRRPIVPGEEPRRVEWLCGALFVVRTELIRKIGGFDPRFFLYWEETDLCKRVGDLGAELWTVGTASAYHVGGASTSESKTPRFAGCIAEHYFESRHYYMRKHHGLVKAVLAEVMELAAMFGVAAIGKSRATLRARLAGPILKTPPVRA